jgi:hypothetical protein
MAASPRSRCFLILSLSSLAWACSPSSAGGDPPASGSTSGSGAGTTSGTGAGAGTGGSTATPPDKPLPGSCQLDDPAFCEDFETQHAGGESGPLDEARWGVSRWSHELQNLFKFYPASTAAGYSPPATFCGAEFSNLLFPDSFAICDGEDGAGKPSKQLHEVFDDTGDFAFHSMLIRQPFDFADRTGIIALDVELKFNRFNVGHGWWVEVWVVEEPVVVPYHGAPAVESFPKNGIGFAFEGFNCDKEAGLNSVSRMVISEGHDIVREEGGGECFQTEEGVLNHLEIRLSQQHAEVWVSDAGKPETFRQVAEFDDLDLAFTRGFVVAQHSAYNAVKDEGTPAQTYRWDNVGFDGPALPRVRGYDVPDNDGEGGQRFGWEVGGSGETFQVEGVDLADAQLAVFNVSFWPYEDNPELEYRLNGGAWHGFQGPDQPGGYSLHSYSMPVDLDELQPGGNTIDLRSPGEPLPIGNLDITVIP